MKPLKHLFYSEPKPTGFFAALLLYEAFFWLVGIAVMATLALLGEYLDGRRVLQRCVAYVLLCVLLSNLVILPLLAHKAAKLRAQHPYSFWEGLRQAILDAKLMLAFIPVVGCLFAPEKTKKEERDID